jgi:hypothetical protein
VASAALARREALAKKWPFRGSRRCDAVPA